MSRIHGHFSDAVITTRCTNITSMNKYDVGVISNNFSWESCERYLKNRGLQSRFDLGLSSGLAEKEGKLGQSPDFPETTLFPL